MYRVNILFAAVVALLALGCSGVKSVELGPTPGQVHVEYEQPATYTINVPVGTCWKMTWKNSAGEEIGSTTGNGPAAGPVPPGATNSDYTQIPCAGTEDVYPVLPRGYPYIFIKSQNPQESSLPITTTWIRAPATSLAVAQANAAVVEQGGPGTALPSGVKVVAYLQVESAGVGQIAVKSSLPERFGGFTVTVNGAVVADWASSLNVTSTPLANGWETLTAVLPTNAGNPNNIVIVTQSEMFGTPVPFTITY